MPERSCSTLFQDVGAFNKKFGLPRYTVSGDPRMGGNTPPHLLNEDELTHKTRHLCEELQEFRDAAARGDLAEAVDALVDLAWVALGTAHFMAVPFDECWEEVRRANMAKVRATSADDPRSKRASTLDIVKPEGFVPPDHSKILGLRQ